MTQHNEDIHNSLMSELNPADAYNEAYQHMKETNPELTHEEIEEALKEQASKHK